MDEEMAQSRPGAAVPVGNVEELWRYPVKSMQGEACDSYLLDERGVAGDRLFAVRNTDGKFGSGKDTKRFRRIDGLLELRARSGADFPQIEFPDGRSFRADEEALARELSRTFGQALSVSREADISHFDEGPVHLLTSASLRWLGSALAQGAADVRRFRPNLLLGQAGAGPVEFGWLGRRMRIGSRVELHIRARAERCCMVALGQADLPRQPELQREIVRMGDNDCGVYADVLVPGRVSVGDEVVLLGRR